MAQKDSKLIQNGYQPIKKGYQPTQASESGKPPRGGTGRTSRITDDGTQKK